MEAKRKKRRWPWVVFALALIAIVALVWLVRQARLAAGGVTYESYTVKYGSVASTITGSGRLAAADTQTLLVPDGVKIADVAVKVGDTVYAGDVLARFEADSLTERAAALSSQLAALDAELARMGAVQTQKTVYSPLSGRLKALFVAQGDDVLAAIAKDGALALVSTDGLMQLPLEASALLKVGEEVTVRWAGGEAKGRVVSAADEGALVTLDDAKAPFGEAAEVYVGGALAGKGTLSIHAPVSVLASGGAIDKIHAKLNDKLTPATKLFTLEDGPFTSAYQLKYAQRTNMAGQLERVLDYVRDPRILAPADGIVGTLALVEDTATGSAMASDSGQSTAAMLFTGSAVKMTLAVDEIDIPSVKLSQTVTVALDAFAGETFAAQVTRISAIGETARSVASFAVEVTLVADARLMLGMNGSATILVDRIDDALLIPVAAIGEDAGGAYVLVGDALVKTYIKTGLSDGENAVVTEGLREGDVVKYARGTTMYDQLMNMRGPFGQSRS